MACFFCEDMVECEYCKRKFESLTALRHVPFCREQYERKAMKQRQQEKDKNKMVARARLDARKKVCSSNFLYSDKIIGINIQD